jgi:hypothetical protein
MKLRTAVKPSHGIFSVTKGLGGGQATVGCPMDTVYKRVASLAQRHFASQNSGDIDVNVFAHRADGARVARDFYHWNNRISDDITLPCGECVNNISSCRH